MATTDTFQAPDAILLIDTREQKEWEYGWLEDRADLDVHVQHTRMETGDYSILGHSNTSAIERKSLSDLAGCAYNSEANGNAKDRFERELDRGVMLDNFEVVVEAPRSYVYDFKNMDNNPHIIQQLHPNSFIGALEAWERKYPSISFTFRPNRAEAAEYAWKKLVEWCDVNDPEYSP